MTTTPTRRRRSPHVLINVLLYEAEIMAGIGGDAFCLFASALAVSVRDHLDFVFHEDDIRDLTGYSKRSVRNLVGRGLWTELPDGGWRAEQYPETWKRFEPIFKEGRR